MAGTERCPRCHGEVRVWAITVDVLALDPPPRQRERWVRLERWQCMNVQAHHGERSVPTEVPPP